MNKSESIAEIATALAKAQAEISNASKNARNPHFKSVYADLAEILNTVRPVFSLHEIAVIQAPQYENGSVSVETMLIHKSGEWVSSSVSAPVSKQDAQGVGSAITYCRRYGLAAMAGIAQEDDDANGAVGGPNTRKAAPARPALAPYPTESFSDNFEKWQTLVESGKKSARDIVAMLESKAVLSNDQREQIMALGTGDTA
jgi:hypothetical protein